MTKPTWSFHTVSMPQNNTSQSTSHLETPGDLIANIPGILGFFPAESIIFAAMFQEGQGTRYTLGPVVRIDINELELLDDVGTALQSVEADLIFTFIISEKVTSVAIEQTVEKLFTTAESGVIDITACWLTTGIYSGESYQLAFGPQPDDLNTTYTGMSDWEHGRIAPVTQAVATKNLLEQGHLPEINRRDAYAAFDRGNHSLNEEDIWELALQAKTNGDEILHAIRHHPHGTAFDAALEKFDSIIHSAAAVRADNTINPLQERPDILRDTATFLTSVLLRDAILHYCVIHPETAADLFLAVAKTFDHTIRSNALCLYSLAAIKLNLGMKAIPALDASLATHPEHSFSGLLRHGLIDGQFDSMITACLRGNEMVRNQYSSASMAGELTEKAEGPDPEEDGGGAEPVQAA